MITIPLQLLSSAPDTEVLDLASKESLAKECDSSDFVNLRGSPRLISLVKWKQDSWHKFLFGRICSPSHTESFEDLWILQLRESLANRTVSPESEAEEVTSDSSLTTGCADLSKCNQEQFSLRMSKDSSQAKCQMELFALSGQSKDWKQWAINLRQEYSRRVKLAHLTNASGSLSWPSVKVSMGGDCPSERRRNTPNLEVAAAQQHGHLTPINPSTNGSHQESWATHQAEKLNSRWVETLMGLPVGWTMPSCLHPIVSPASAVMMSSAGNAEVTTQIVHALGQIAVMSDNRTDELRLLGNGVVPATATLAFQTLLAELLNE